MNAPHHVVIIGGGFGGLTAARRLRRAPVRVTLVDRQNFHLFQPLLYQVATGGLSPANIATPLRALLKRQQNTAVILAEVVEIDVQRRRAILSDGELDYDTLIVAAGARHHYFGHAEWEQHAPGLKTIENATRIRRRILLAFEAAERETDPVRRQACLTFVVVGAGPTGVELAGTLAELAHHTLRKDFRNIDPSTARILLVECADRVLQPYPSGLSAKAARALTRLGVTVRTGTNVTEVLADSVTLRSGEQDERIATHTVLWAAGVEASPLAQNLASATGATLDRSCRVTVLPDLTLPGHPEIFVIGDMAHCSDQAGKPLPGVAPVAIQQAKYAADLIQLRPSGRALSPFHYKDRGTMSTIGRAEAVVDLGWLRFSGFIAWLVWLFVHLMSLVTFGNRALVLMQWAGNYVTRNRSARLITGESPLPLVGRASSPPAAGIDRAP